MKRTMSNADILDIIAEVDQRAKKRHLTMITDKRDLTTEDRFKLSLCRYFVQYMHEHKMQPVDLHKETGIEQSRISEIINYKISKFTISKLVVWLEILAKRSAKVREHLHLLEEVLNVPMKTAQESKEMAKKIKRTSGGGVHHYA